MSTKAFFQYRHIRVSLPSMRWCKCALYSSQNSVLQHRIIPCQFHKSPYLGGYIYTDQFPCRCQMFLIHLHKLVKFLAISNAQKIADINNMKTYLTWGMLNRVNPFASQCISRITNCRRSTPNAPMSISFRTLNTNLQTSIPQEQKVFTWNATRALLISFY